jgi:CRISPR-associated protein Csm2
MAFTDRIIFTGKIDPDLFDGIADKTAEFIAKPADERKDGQKNKSTQLRKYYDELSMWEQKIRQISDKDKADEYYKNNLPLIKMLNAKIAYANGRKLVDDNFLKLMRHCLGQLTEDKKTFETCKLFLEAFMGFYKVYKPQ